MSDYKRGWDMGLERGRHAAHSTVERNPRSPNGSSSFQAGFIDGYKIGFNSVRMGMQRKQEKLAGRKIS